HVFVGDIRHFGLLNTFHASVLSQQQSWQEAGELTTTEDFQQKVLQRQHNDKELLVDPQLFVALLKSNPRVSGLSIRPHRGSAHNELTRFRYQVILNIEHTPTVDAIEVDWLNWSQTPLTIQQLRQRLEAQAPAVLGVRNVANARLEQDNATVKWMNAGEENGEGNFAALQQSLARQPLTGLDPQTVWQLADVLSYDVELSWAQADPQGRFDVLFKKRGHKAAQTARFGLPVCSTAFGVNNWHQYANNPLQYQLSEKLVPQLREYLGEELPDYMVPSHFIFLDKLPLTANGKIDRATLRLIAPEADILSTTQIVAPRNETETLLASLWSDVLKIDVNSIMAHFFDLGGHSLL
ncbi:MAG: hypothetical protein MJK04_29155, partial [Psychrosphaera sp.]|nr:hypothetical protein [Psychrosphaera sp.]